MTCKICTASKLKKIDTFKPYQDKTWRFEIYDCLRCKTRFALRDSNICYHEEIHASKDSAYQTHYQMAKKVKALLNSDLLQCQQLLIHKSQAIHDLLDYIEKQPKEIRILEIGCSTGYVTAFLQKLGYYNTLGIDISQTAIDYAQSMFGSHYALQADKKNYDVIFHVGLIGCVNDPKEFLHLYLDCLDDDGVMFFNAPNVNSIYETKELWVSTPPPDLIYLFQKEGLIKMIDNPYLIQIKEMASPANSIIKYINKFKKRENNIYPRRFSNTRQNTSNKHLPYFIKSALFVMIRLLIVLKVIKKIPDEYGLIAKITKK